MTGSASSTAPETAPTEIGADLRHVRSWVFDLDNTLYPPETQFLRQVEQRINQYVVRTSGLESAEALSVQRGYLHDYGTSLAGLMMHDIDPHHFLAEVHDVPLDVLAPDPGLHAALERLQGPRLIFTNGSAGHAQRVMEKLELTPFFDGVFALEDADLIPKPDPRTFHKMLARFGVDPATACFFEDTPKNLEPARNLGMTTVLVGTKAFTAEGDHIQHRAASLGPFLTTAMLDGDPQ
ncbi:pyrimidine 5'-nucleotidase [Brevundimonas sp. UBA7507]|uniref:pyrimidine 5'-nucleotidase n=1 Tax=Brevundimonas sp. UBA7507 TaxID=1946137 RepID=UPI00257D6387|nr:pyrimidine 5'-nucleotidase [Brevundimonas sp. UBA7507]